MVYQFEKLFEFPENENYWISEFGDVWSLYKDKFLKPKLKKHGYLSIGLYNNGKVKHYCVHYLVARTFLGERPEGLEVDHIDRNKLNNHVLNLRWVTRKIQARNKITYREDILVEERGERKKVFKKEYYEQNKEKINSRAKEYREKNKDTIKAQKKDYREKNKEKISARAKEYYEQNKEKISARGKEYYEQNKEKIAAQKKDYREENKEKENAKNKEKVECECGKIVSRVCLSRHRKSEFHQNFLQSKN